MNAEKVLQLCGRYLGGEATHWQQLRMRIN
jgi:hypothetical protein